MITIRKINIDELHKLITYDELDISFKKQCDSNNNKEYFAVIDGDKVLGHALVFMFHNISIAQINEIYILPQERKQGLGDGLLRTVFNYLRIHLFNRTIIKNHKELGNFLINKGIKEIDFQNLSENIKSILKNDYKDQYYICNIEEFFKRKCC